MAQGNSGALTASFRLTLEDLLSPALVKIMAEVKKLGELAKALRFDHLRTAADDMREASRGAEDLARGMGDVRDRARSAADAVQRLGREGRDGLSRMASEASAVARQVSAVGGAMRAALAARFPAIGAGVPGSGSGTNGGGFGPPIPPGAPWAGGGGGPRLLTGPGASGRYDDIPYLDWEDVTPGRTRRRRGPLLPPGFARDEAGRAYRDMRGRLGGMHNDVGVIEGAAAGYSVMEPIREYARLDQTVRQIATISGLSGDAAEAETHRLMTMFRRESTELGIPMERIAESYAYLRRAMGMSREDADRAIEAHGKLAVAYHVDPDAMGQGVYAAMEQFKLPREQFEQGLATIAIGANAGHFNIADASRALPAMGATLGKMGIGGREGIATAMALLQTARLGSPDSGTATTDVQEMLSYIFQGIANQSFGGKGRGLSPEVKKLIGRNLGGATGVDLPRMLLDAEKAGVNPIDAFMGKLQQITKGMTPVETNLVLNALLHNHSAARVITTLLQHGDTYTDLRQTLRDVDPARLQRDLNTQMAGPGQQPDILDANAKALEVRAGRGFFDLLPSMTKHLQDLNAEIEDLDTRWPGLVDHVLVGAGAFLGLLTTLGLLKFAWGPIAGGAKLLWGTMQFLIAGVRGLIYGFAALPWPLKIVTTGLVAAAVDIYENWDRFGPMFGRLGEDVLQGVGGVGNVLAGAFTLDPGRIAAGWEQIKSGFSGGMEALWGKGGIMETLMGDFADWVDGWSDGLATKLGQGIMTGLNAAKGAIETAIDGIKKLFDGTPIVPNFPQVPIDKRLTQPADPAGAPAVRGSPVDVDGARGVGAGGSVSPDTRTAPGFERNNLYLRGGAVFGAPPPAPPPPAEVHIRVSADPGLRIEANPGQDNGRTTVRVSPDRGTVLGRP